MNAPMGDEFRGKTVEEATEAGLAALGLKRSQVEIEILSRGSRGLLGFGAEDARVRITPIPSAGQATAAKREAPPPKPPKPAPPAVEEKPAAPPKPAPAQKPSPPKAAPPRNDTPRSAGVSAEAGEFSDQ